MRPISAHKRFLINLTRTFWAFTATFGFGFVLLSALLIAAGLTIHFSWDGYSTAKIVTIIFGLLGTFSVVYWLAECYAFRIESNGRKVIYMSDSVDLRQVWYAAGGIACVLMLRHMSKGSQSNEAYSFIIPAYALTVMGLDLLLRVGRIGFGAEIRKSSHDEYHYLLSGTRSMAHQNEANDQASKAVENVVNPVRPRFNFDAVQGMLPLKRKLVEAGAPVVRPPKGHHAAQNGILMFSEPGNGKTFIAEALAGELNVNFIAMDYGRVVSEWVGKTPKNIVRAFEQAKNAQPCVLFLDEIDSFILSRDGASNTGGERDQIVNVLLTELVNIRKHRVLVIAATNRMDKLDNAAIREGRFDFKIEIPAPDEAARIGLLTQSLKKSVATPFSEEAVLSAAKRWNGFSVKRIMAVGEHMPTYLRKHPASIIGYEELMGSLRSIQGTKGRVPENTKSLDELVLPPATKTAVDMVAKRLMDTLRIERLGGALPSGVLFHGPSGTGKTAVARALAKQTGWAFLSVAGPDLLGNLDTLEKLYMDAKNLRPCIIFIDEADDCLRDRSYSQTSAITNKLLTVMDGASDKVKDVIFIAATNNPEQIDPALLRAGRFTEKVPFVNADKEGVAILVERWLARSKVSLRAGASTARVAAILEGLSPANVEGVLQYALNAAIHESTDDTVTLSLDHIARGLDIVAA